METETPDQRELPRSFRICAFPESYEKGCVIEFAIGRYLWK